jgi:hypothetical protein
MTEQIVSLGLFLVAQLQAPLYRDAEALYAVLKARFDE